MNLQFLSREVDFDETDSPFPNVERSSFGAESDAAPAGRMAQV
jgi:hypothetical protein